MISINQGTLYEGFENLGDWTAEGSVGYSVTADIDNKKQGSQSIALHVLARAGLASFTQAKKTINTDFSAVSNFIFWVYISDRTKLNCIHIYFTSVADWSKELQLSIDACFDGPEFDKGFLVDGWNRIVALKSDFVAAGGENWANTMIRMNVRATGLVNSSCFVNFDDLRTDYSSKAQCIIVFDDGTYSTKALAEPVMTANGQVGSSAPVQAWLREVRLSIADLHYLRLKRWDVCNHSKNHPTLTELGADELDKEVNDFYTFLCAHGFAHSAEMFMYPGGAFNDTVIAKVREHHKMARCVINGKYQPIIEPDGAVEYALKIAHPVDSSSGSIINVIDDAIERYGLFILLIHDVAITPEYEWQHSLADFQAVSNYLKANSGSIDVVSFSQYYDYFAKPFARSETPDYGESTPIIGQCYDGSRRVYEMRDVQTFMNIKMSMRQAEWHAFKTKLEIARYRKSTFIYTDSEYVDHTVRLMNSEIPEPLMGITPNGTEMYNIQMRVREES